MIAIVNTGTVDAEGRHIYRLQINHDVLCTFAHHRPDGLAKCLRLAIEAFEHRQAKRMEKIIAAAEAENNKRRKLRGRHTRGN